MSNQRNIRIIAIAVITIVVVFFIASFIPRGEGYSLIKISSIDSILNINEKITYLSNGQILAAQLGKSSLNSEVIDRNITSHYNSPDNNKTYYALSSGNNLKSYVLDYTNNNKKEFNLYSGFLWQENQPRFVNINNGKASILDESLNVVFSNLNYQNFISYSNIVLGQPENSDPDQESNTYNVINTNSTSLKSLDLSNIMEDTSAWTNGKYLMYLNSDDKFVTIDNTGKKSTYDFALTDRQISSGNNELEYFIIFENTNAIIKSVNLSNGKISKVKTLNKEEIKSKTGVELEKINQIYKYNKDIYIVSNKQLLRVSI